MIEPDTNPTREYMAKQLFTRTWLWLMKQGYVEFGNVGARKYAEAQLEARGWPVPTASLLIYLWNDYARRRFEAAQKVVA